MDLKKDSNKLYSLIAEILDCDYRRLVDAFDNVDNDILCDAIDEAKDNDCLSLNGIMSEVIYCGINELEDDFIEESKEKMSKLNKESDEYKILESFDICELKESINCASDGVISWSEIYSSCSLEEMKIFIQYFSDSFKKLENLIGSIDGLPV